MPWRFACRVLERAMHDEIHQIGTFNVYDWRIEREICKIGICK